MPQPYLDTKINCLEQLTGELEVILEVDPTDFLRFSLISNVNININFTIGKSLHDDYCIKYNVLALSWYQMWVV